MGRFKYTHPQDNIGRLASWALASGTLLAGSSLANLVDGDPSNAAVFSSAGFRVVGDLGTPTALAVCALDHVAGDASLAARFQANSADSWGAPAIDRALTLAAPDEDGYWPSPLADLTDLDVGSRTYRYVSIYFPNGTQLPRLGEILLYSILRTFPNGDDIAWNYHDPERYGVERIQTNHGIQLKYLRTPRWQEFIGRVPAHDSTLAALRSWRRACRAQNCLIQPDADVPVGLHVEWAIDDLDPDHLITNASTVPVAFRQVHPGLAWIDPDA